MRLLLGKYVVGSGGGSSKSAFVLVGCSGGEKRGNLRGEGRRVDEIQLGVGQGQGRGQCKGIFFVR